MKRKILVISTLFICVWMGCRSLPIAETVIGKPVLSVSVDTLLTDSISIRALLVDGGKIWYSGSKGRFGYFDTKAGNVFRGKLDDALQSDFRSMAHTQNYVFVLNAGSPATLYRISKEDMGSSVVYREEGEKVFYDSMHFAGDGTGYAMGDPVGECLSVIKSTDSGNTWKRIACDGIMPAAQGEAAFAASNSTLVLKGDHVWMASGGIRSRVWHSSDGGIHWDAYNTPIAEGRPMTGIFSADFYDEQQGIVAGGDYENLDSNVGNKAITSDGGKTWLLVADGEGPGYISSVQYIPGGSGRELITAGATGIHYSADGGKSWTRLLDDKKIYVLRCVDGSTVYAAGLNKMIRINLLRK